MRVPVKGKVTVENDGRLIRFIFDEPINVSNGDQLIIDSYYGFGNVFAMYIERKEAKDENVT